MNEGSDQSRTTRASSGRASRRLGPNYTKLWSSSVVSNLGDGIDLAALPLIAAGLTRDPLVFSGVAIAGRLPWLLFTLPAGALIDRLDRKRVMGMVNLARFTLMGALGLAVLSDRMSIWLLYGVSFALGMAETLFDSAAQALVPSLVRRDQLEVANGRLYGAEVVANQFLGPPLGGALFGGWLSDRVGGAIEARLPQTLADHCDRLRIGALKGDPGQQRNQQLADPVSLELGRDR